MLLAYTQCASATPAAPIITAVGSHTGPATGQSSAACRTHNSSIVQGRAKLTYGANSSANITHQVGHSSTTMALHWAISELHALRYLLPAIMACLQQVSSSPTAAFHRPKHNVHCSTPLLILTAAPSSSRSLSSPPVALHCLHQLLYVLGCCTVARQELNHLQPPAGLNCCHQCLAAHTADAVVVH